MTDDPLELLSGSATAPLDDEAFIRDVLRRGRITSRPGRRRLVYAAAAVTIAICVLGSVAIGPIGPALGATAAITWAIGELGDR